MALTPSSSTSKNKQGWLVISHDISETAEWQKRYCIIDRNERKLYFFLDQESAVIKPPTSPSRRLLTPDVIDGGVISSMKRSSNSGSFTLAPGDNPFQRGARTTRSFRDRVKSTLKTKKGVGRPETYSATSGSVQRAGLARSKSWGKPEGDLILPRMRGGRSLENLHRVSSNEPEGQISLGEPGTFVDLATKGTLSIQMVHPSVSPRHSCFRLITDADILYASCGSSEELHKWVTSLNECHRPNRDHLRRLSTQICVWIFEARNLQPKKKYFCEVYLNNILYCQTCCKLMNDILFWGEPFIFEELPMLGSVHIKLYKETYKKRDNVVELIGKIEIPTLILDTDQVTEKWYPVTLFHTPKSQISQKEQAAIRIKIQYQVVSILPLKCYDGLLNYIKSHFAALCDVLEPVISAKTKDEIAQTLLRVLEHSGKAREFLCDIVMAEVQHVDNENLIFRGNTFATKAVDTYMKMVGEGYLRDTLKHFICELLESEEECEVDPMRLTPTMSLQSNQQVLMRFVEKVWIDILSSWTRFPSDLRDTLYGIRQRFGVEREDACFKLISGSIFLRFFCPAILSPSLFQLCQEYPTEKKSRKLTLVAKVIQSLANFTRFGVKEEYMCFMNEFVEREIKNMKQFIDRISSPVPDSYPVVEWGPYHIDLGRELSIIHTTLLNLIPNLKEDALAQVSELPDILRQITNTIDEAKEDPFSSTFEALRVMQSTISKFTPQSLKAPRSHTHQTLSNSSSEYTTPAQSTSASPTADRRPLSQAVFGLSPTHLTTHSRQISAPAEWAGSSPTLSPTHPITKTPPTLGHRSSSSMPQQQLDQLHHETGSCGSSSPSSHASPIDDQGRIPPSLDLKTSHSHNQLPEVVMECPSPRRNSDSAIHKFSIHPKKKDTKETSKSAESLENNLSFRFDQTIQIADLTAENSHLLQERDRIMSDLRESQTRIYQLEKENEKLKQEIATSETSRKKAEANLRSLRENRGKVLRGLNTQTEIAMVQFRRDFEYLKKQVEMKDETILLQERKIKSLLEANCSLRNGVEQTQGLETESEDDEGLFMMNGHSQSNSVQVELAKFISQLDI